MNNEIKKSITQFFIDSLTKGELPWKSGIIRSARPGNFKTKNFYQGINRLMLMCRMNTTPWFLTMKQGNAMGLVLKAGSRAIRVVYWNFSYFDKRNKSAKALSQELYDSLSSGDQNFYNRVPFLRYHNVFPLDNFQGDSLTEYLAEAEALSKRKVLSAEEIIGRFEGVGITNGGAEPSYSVQFDQIFMPEKWQFDCIEQYYETLFHEMIHATGAMTRLNRTSLTACDRAMEELIAEIGAAFLCSECNIFIPTVRDRSASYIASWLEAMGNDPQFVFDAAQHAEKAVDYILNGAIRSSSEDVVQQAA